MTTHVCSLVSALLLTVLISRAKAQQYQQYYDMEEDTGEEEDAIIDVSHPEYYDLEDGDKQEDGFLDVSLPALLLISNGNKLGIA